MADTNVKPAPDTKSEPLSPEYTRYTLLMLQTISSETKEREILLKVFGNWHRDRDVRTDSSSKPFIRYTMYTVKPVAEDTLAKMCQYFHELKDNTSVTLVVEKVASILFIQGVAEKNEPEFS